MPEKDISTAFNREMIELLEQSMVKIRHCLGQLTDEQVWWRPVSELNSIGNLLLHLNGNLKQWAVSGVGDDTDDRQRQQEFDQRQPIPAATLIEQLEQTVAAAKEVVAAQSIAEWQEIIEIQEFSVSKLGAIVHTTSHFVGHTHQIIMLTRMQLGSRYGFQWSPDDDRTQIPI